MEDNTKLTYKIESTEAFEIEVTVKALDVYYALIEVKDYIRQYWKYGVPEDKSKEDLIEDLYNSVLDIISDLGIKD